MVSARQVNVQIPYTALGPGELTIRNENGAAKVGIVVAPAAPALFANSLFHADDTAVTTESPAVNGEALVLYATGLGTPEDESPVVVRLGGGAPIPATATIVKSVPGLYAIRFRLSNAPLGAVPVAVVAGTAVSNTLTAHCRPS
jgi:uncharacterized protein (TIGR03437 family)